MQGVGRDAGGQQLLHERAELAEKIRPGHDGGIEFQLLAHLLGGKIEGQHTAVFVQIFLAHAAADGKHPRSQPREAQNLRIAADGIAAAGAERALGLVGILLGDDEDLAGDAGPGVFADLIEDPHGIGRPVRPAEDLQHGRASFGFFLILACRAEKEKGWKCRVPHLFRHGFAVPPSPRKAYPLRRVHPSGAPRQLPLTRRVLGACAPVGPPLPGEVARRSRDGEVAANLRRPLSQPAADSSPARGAFPRKKVTSIWISSAPSIDGSCSKATSCKFDAPVSGDAYQDAREVSIVWNDA